MALKSRQFLSQNNSFPFPSLTSPCRLTHAPLPLSFFRITSSERTRRASLSAVLNTSTGVGAASLQPEEGSLKCGSTSTPSSSNHTGTPCCFLPGFSDTQQGTSTNGFALRPLVHTHQKEKDTSALGRVSLCLLVHGFYTHAKRCRRFARTHRHTPSYTNTPTSHGWHLSKTENFSYLCTNFYSYPGAPGASAQLVLKSSS